jgi:predicted esterase
MEEHHITVPRGARYHTLGNAAKAKEIWIVLHGYGQLARYFLRAFEGLEQERFIVAPEALSRFYLDDAHTRVGATWMTREDREQEIVDQLAHLDALAAYVSGACAPGVPISALGFSQGVSTLARWSVLGSTNLHRVAFWGGSLPPELSAPDMHARWSRSRIDLVHGEQDRIVNADSLSRSEAQLLAAGVPYRVLRFNGGHELDRLTLSRVLES